MFSTGAFAESPFASTGSGEVFSVSVSESSTAAHSIIANTGPSTPVFVFANEGVSTSDLSASPINSITVSVAESLLAQSIVSGAGFLDINAADSAQVVSTFVSAMSPRNLNATENVVGGDSTFGVYSIGVSTAVSAGVGDSVATTSVFLSSASETATGLDFLSVSGVYSIPVVESATIRANSTGRYFWDVLDEFQGVIWTATTPVDSDPWQDTTGGTPIDWEEIDPRK